ncbi:MAG TPA: hypothetical protein VFY30_10205 [Solirubrobacterales bacterium]|nr:hypothetical protein [Solirubrobacterales bacterium]
MNDWRTKIAVLAVVLGLGGLGGYAMSANRRAADRVNTPVVPTTHVIRRTVHKKPKHKRSAGSTPGATAAGSLTSAPVSSGSSGSSSSSPPVSTGTSGSGGGGGAVHTGSSGSGGGGGESEGGGGGEGGGEGGD